MTTTTRAQQPTGSRPTAPQDQANDPRRWVALGVVLTAAFMVLLDLSIVNVAIPSIRSNLNASYAEVQFVISGYALAYAVMLITGGRLGDIFGRKRLFMIGMAGFTVASTLCGLSFNGPTLVGARVLQGLMAALMYPQVLSVIQVSFAPRERGKAFGVFGAIVGISTVMGPVVGGLIIRDDITGGSWRWVFLVNVPVGIVSLIAAFRLLHESRAPQAKRLDIPGVLLASVGLFLIVYPLVEGREADWAMWTFLSMAAGVVVMAVFFVYQARIGGRRTDTVSKPGKRLPLVELELFRNRGFSAGAAMSAVFFSAIPSFFFIFSVMMQIGLGYSALRAGLTTVPFSIGSALASGMSIKLAPKLGKRILMIGCALGVLGIAGLIAVVHTWSPDITSGELLLPLFVAGLGLGSVVAPLINIILSGVPPRDAGSASGVLTTVQQLGGGIGVAVVGVIFFGLLGSRAGVASSTVTPQLRQDLVAAQPHAPATQIDGQVTTFAHCFGVRAAAKDPSSSIDGCPAPATGNPGDPVTAAFATAGRVALATDFSAALERSVLYQVIAFSASFLLVLALPRRRVAPPGGATGAATPAH